MEGSSNIFLVVVSCVVGGVLAGVLLIKTLCYCPRRTFPVKNRVVAITGGSSGIGLSVAQECVRRGAHVILLARKEGPLRQACEELQALAAGGGGSSSSSSPSQRILYYSADVTDEQAMKGALEKGAKECGGRIDAVVCSAGASLPREFTATPASDFEAQFRLNVIGTRNAIFNALPFMNSSDGGRVVIISSQAGQVGLYGFTAYSSSKFALNGLAQALAMELASRKILVSVAYPPDTDTPGLAAENVNKPSITKRLSEATSTVPPEVVGKAIVGGMEQWSPTITVGFDGWMLATLCSGFTPVGTVVEGVVQVLTVGLWRLVAIFYVNFFYGVVLKGDK